MVLSNYSWKAASSFLETSCRFSWSENDAFAEVMFELRMVTHCSSAVFPTRHFGTLSWTCLSLEGTLQWWLSSIFPSWSCQEDIWKITSVHITDLGTFCRNVLLNHPGNQPKHKSQFCKKNPKKVRTEGQVVLQQEGKPVYRNQQAPVASWLCTRKGENQGAL